ncbi:phage minor head protein [Pseudomonas sp. D47]|uniref:phage head morphogenesis protein n=1 Tax=Pseudomonas sp. D47 TaxID=3159447 RepID=UPI00387A99C9
MIDLVALAPKEAVEYFKQKGYTIGFDHRDVWQAQHQAGFTVAKVMQQDLLEDIRKAVDDALSNGMTVAQFSQALTPTLVNKGWWGRKAMTDPLTGEVVDAQLGSPNRLKTIYDTNLRTSHSEGQWQRIQENKEAFPYLQYDANNSAHPRAEHSAWDGLTLPVDHPFFRDHFPVKDYKCKCRVIPRTANQVNNSGRAVGPAPVVPTVPFINKRTGELQHIPKGVNPSFYYPPGGRRASLNRHLIDRLESAPPDVARASIADLVKGPAFAGWYRRPAGAFVVAHLDHNVATRMGAKTQLVAFSEETLKKQLREHPEVTIQEYSLIQSVVDRGRAITDAKDGSLIYVLEEAGYVAVIKATKTGKAIFMTSFRRLSSREAQRDREVRRLLSKASPRAGE